MKYDNVKIGMKVDYHSEIGGPITRPFCTVESTPWMIGHGEWVVLLTEMRGAISLNALSVPKEEPLNKEEIYDQKIRPHMDEILKTCAEYEIPMAAEFYVPTYDKPTLCVSSSIVENIDRVPNHILDIMSLQQVNRAGLYRYLNK